MRRSSLWVLGLAALGAMPVIAVLAQPPGTATVTITRPASGTVDHYEVRVTEASGTRTIYKTLANGLTLTLPALPPEPYWVDTRACDASSDCGEWGEKKAFPVNADIDGDGLVASSDFAHLAQHFGKRLIWDPVLEVDAYVDE